MLIGTYYATLRSQQILRMKHARFAKNHGEQSDSMMNSTYLVKDLVHKTFDKEQSRTLFDLYHVSKESIKVQSQTVFDLYHVSKD